MAKTYLLDGQGAPFKNNIRFLGAKPLDGRAVVDSYSDIEGNKYIKTFTNTVDDTEYASYYPGMLVVTKDTGKLYVLATDGLFKEVTPDLSKVLGSISVDFYRNALEKAKSDNIGQIIYVKTTTYKKGEGYTEDKSEADKDENGKVTEYSAAPYIVIGSGQLQKLEASTASGDISADLRQLAGTVAEIDEAYKKADGELDGRIDDIEETIGNSEGGLIKDIADLKQADIDLDNKFDNYYDITTANGKYATKDEFNPVKETVDGLSNVYLSKKDAETAYETIENVKLVDNKVATHAQLISDLSTNLSTVSGAVDALSNNVYTKEDADTAFKLSWDKGNLNSETGIKSYTFTQGSETFTIDIPKELFITDGEVVDLAEGEVEGEAAGTYIKLVLNNLENTPLYIAADSLVDEYTANEEAYLTLTGRQFSVKYDALKNQISADIKASEVYFENSKVETLTSNITASYTAAIATAQQAAIDAAATAAESLYVTQGDYAGYQEELSNTFAGINGEISGLSKTVGENSEGLTAVQSTVTSLINTVSGNTNAINDIKVTILGSETVTGLVSIINNHTTEIGNIKEAAEGTVKGIKLTDTNTVTADENGIVTILTTDSLNDENTSKLVTIAAVKDEINSKAKVIIEDTDPVTDLSAKNIYIIGSDDTGYNGKVLGKDGKLHTLGAETYVGKEDYASETAAGLMTSADYNFLHSFERINDEDFRGIGILPTVENQPEN